MAALPNTLTTYLSNIVTIKSQIDGVLSYATDVTTPLSQYPTYIQAAIEGAGGGIDWDDVAGYGYIVPAGTYNISQNGTFDVSAYANAYVSVPAAIPSEYGDIAFDSPRANYIVAEEPSELDFFDSLICENVTVTYVSQNNYTIEWDDLSEDQTIIHVCVPNQSFNFLYDGFWDDDNDEFNPEFYGNVRIILEVCTITASEDPKDDGYNYLVEADGYIYLNPQLNGDYPLEATENGFYVIDGQSAVKVDVPFIIDPYDGAIKDLYEFIDEGDGAEAEYVDLGPISDNFTLSDDGNGNYTIEYDINYNFNDNDIVVHVYYSGTGNYFVNFLDNNDEFYEELYDNIWPVGQGGVLTESEDPSEDGYDYLITVNGFAYQNYWGDISNEPQEITENGNIVWEGSPLLKVNVSGGGGSGSDYEKYTVSDVVTFENDSRFGPYMWYFEANELDGEDDGNPDYATISAGFFSTKYWGYCYPNEFEVEINPVLDMDGEPGLYMVSYTDLVKRDYDFNSLPDFNTYRGYTYSYEYANPYYNDENAPEGANTWDETLSYEFNYGEDLLYKTTLNIAQLSDRQKAAPNEIINGVWRVFDDSQPGLTGYYDETEYGEGNYANQQWLSIGCLSPAETDGGPVTQFTTTYHHAASYTTGFDPRTLCGYVWQAVVDGRGWLVDLIDNEDDLVFSEMRLSDGDDENAAYLDDDRNDFIQEIELSDSNTTFDGLYIYAVDDSGDYTKNYKLHINDLNAYDLLVNNQITVGASCTADVTIDNGWPYLYVDMSLLNDFYSSWDITLELVIPNTIKADSEVTLRVTAFTGEPNR